MTEREKRSVHESGGGSALDAPESPRRLICDDYALPADLKQIQGSADWRIWPHRIDAGPKIEAEIVDSEDDVRRTGGEGDLAHATCHDLLSSPTSSSMYGEQPIFLANTSDRRPARNMLAFEILNHRHRASANLGREFVRHFDSHSATIFRILSHR
jgi:hypothetical protein